MKAVTWNQLEVNKLSARARYRVVRFLAGHFTQRLARHVAQRNNAMGEWRVKVTWTCEGRAQ